MRRVVVTGVGMVTPCGLTTDATWRALTEGRSGIAPIEQFDASEYASQIAGECTGFDPELYVEKKRVREGTRFIHLAIAAADQAVAMAGFEPDDALKERTGTFVGVGMCGLEMIEKMAYVVRDRGPRRITPYFIPSVIANLAPGQLSMRYGLKSVSTTLTSACASGGHAIGEAFEWIKRGGIDAALVGGAEACITPLGIGGFCAMRALSKRNDDPERASRPFDKGRDGFVMGEGAAILVLEELSAAKKRGATILAEVRGYGATADAYHLTQPAPGGEGAARAMKMALQEAACNPSDIDMINAHGTSTPTGDMQELLAIRDVFGAHATGGLAVSSTKSMHGHLLGAAGGLEAAISVLSIRDGVIAPTINLDDPDEEAQGFDLVPHQARETRVATALSNSFGFGGTNVSLVFSSMRDD